MRVEMPPGEVTHSPGAQDQGANKQKGRARSCSGRLCGAVHTHTLCCPPSPSGPVATPAGWSLPHSTCKCSQGGHLCSPNPVFISAHPFCVLFATSGPVDHSHILKTISSIGTWVRDYFHIAFYPFGHVSRSLLLTFLPLQPSITSRLPSPPLLGHIHPHTWLLSQPTSSSLAPA